MRVAVGHDVSLPEAHLAQKVRRAMLASSPAESDSQSTWRPRCALAVLVALALAGIVLGWRGGQLPHRQAANAGKAGADLALYGEIVAAVRAGEDYYSAARQRLPEYGFPTKSPLNWRLPTYAWVFAGLPHTRLVQGMLVVLAAATLYVAFQAQRLIHGLAAAIGTTVLLAGIVGWSLDGQAYLAQEVWAATLMALSLAAHSLAEHSLPTPSVPGARRLWTTVAIFAGISALLLRELALPYCGVACLLAAWNRRWVEAAGWAVGIAAFLGFFAWHVLQVKHALEGTGTVGGGLDLAQWLRFGGLDFVLLTTRLNRLLFAAPGWLVWLYVLASLLGLSRRPDRTSKLACLAALAYLLAFAIVGRPENFYWGLLPAPLLAWGAARAPLAFGEWWRACGFAEASDGQARRAATGR